MTTKAFAGNALPETRVYNGDADSLQTADKIEVAAPCLPENVEKNGDSLRSIPANSSANNEMQTRVTKTSRSISHKRLSANELRRSSRCEDEKDAREKPPRTNGRETFLRWWRFNLVGAIGIAVQLAALILLKSVFHFNYLAATAVAVEAAVVHNFVWHEQFTWADRVEPAWRKSPPRFVRFNLTAGGVSIIGNLALMRVMVGFGHMNYFAANAIAIALCSVANFLVSDEWVFEKPAASDQ